MRLNHSRETSDWHLKYFLAKLREQASTAPNNHADVSCVGPLPTSPPAEWPVKQLKISRGVAGSTIPTGPQGASTRSSHPTPRENKWLVASNRDCAAHRGTKRASSEAFSMQKRKSRVSGEDSRRNYTNTAQSCLVMTTRRSSRSQERGAALSSGFITGSSFPTGRYLSNKGP